MLKFNLQILPGLAAFCALLMLPLAAHAQKDIQCGVSKTRYEQPAECAAACKGSIDAERCMIQPNLAALKDGFFQSFYNFSLFFGANSAKAKSCSNNAGVDASLGATSGMNVVPAVAQFYGFGAMGAINGAPREKLVERIFGAWLHPNNYSDFTVVWGSPAGSGDAWTGVTKGSAQGKCNLNISVLSLCKTPAALVSELGHEMIHVEQFQREPGYKGVHIPDIEGASFALREVEAYSWELKTVNFPWKIGPSKWLAGQAAGEKQEAVLLKSCYEWKALAQIDKIKHEPFSGPFVDELGRYFEQDPWISANWLPSHTDWKTKAAPAEPEACKKADF
jgi:hypothetical protein